MHFCVMRFLAALVVLPVVLMIALRSDTLGSNTAANRPVDGPGLTFSTFHSSEDAHSKDSPQKSNDIQKFFLSSPNDVCEQLRRVLRGNTTAELSSRFLTHVYHQEKLMPTNSRLVFRIHVPKRGIGLCNARTYVLDGID